MGRNLGYKFLSKSKNLHNEKKIENYYGSCWSLQIDDRRLFITDDEFNKSSAEIQKLGSASMWENYCKNGGVRIKTTVEKILNILSAEKEIWHEECYYEPSMYIKKRPNTIEETLFHKRTCFRHENEYRFLIYKEYIEEILPFKISNLREFIDEILICPNTKANAWISKSIYKTFVNSDIGITKNSTNLKNGKQYCRISQMYGLISEEV